MRPSADWDMTRALVEIPSRGTQRSQTVMDFSTAQTGHGLTVDTSDHA